jgi:hypothetical protein
MQPRLVRMGRMEPLPSPIALVASDAGRAWRTESADDGAPAVTVRGTASSLALLLRGRVPPDDAALVVDGDRAVVDDALSGRLTP